MILALIAIANAGMVAHATPKFDKQPHPESVFAEHWEALNDCDVDRLMAQYPENVVLVLPNGNQFVGREDARDLFSDFCADGPVFEFTELSSWTVGKTVIVQWVLTNPDILCEEYYGADAFITKNGLLAAQVATFNGDDLKFVGVHCPFPAD
jgi:hypothetical protein